MPFNRVTDMKSMVMWLLILKEDEVANLEALKLDPTTQLKVRKIPTYYPGMMLIPIPEAGFCLGHVDMAWWAVFLYLLGSIVYVADSYYLWGLTNPAYSDDAENPENYLNTLAALLFVVNAVVCFIDWWLQFKQLSAMNLLYDESLTGGVHISDVPHKMSVYYFYNNLFFLGAAVIYMIQAIWEENPHTDIYNCNTKFCGSFWINFWGSMLYLLSSIFAVLECYEAYKLRASQGLPPLLWFSTTFNMIDWFGWGDVLYLVTSLIALLQCFLASFVDSNDDLIAPIYLAENWMFLFDSSAYFVGYCLFIYELRQTMVTGMVDAKQTGVINTLIGDNYEEYDQQQQRPSEDFGHYRGSLCANADGRFTMKEIRFKLNEARNIRMRKTAERLSHGVESGPVRNTIGGVFEMTSVQVMNRNKCAATAALAASNSGDQSRQRSASFSGAVSPLFK